MRLFLKTITIPLLLALLSIITNLLASEDFEEGTYTIRNRDLPCGLLCWAADPVSTSGRFAQLLEDGRFDKDKILPGASWRNSILWDISR
jgi:hypothetical protein